jgi:tRNA G18 (ribose-2'-O)-methylase SpoU
MPEARVILLIGAEGPGLTLEAMRSADFQVGIPMAAEVDSLNVTVAAGIALAFLDGR